MPEKSRPGTRVPGRVGTAGVTGRARRRATTGDSMAQTGVRTARPTGPRAPAGARVHIVLITSPTSSGGRIAAVRPVSDPGALEVSCERDQDSRTPPRRRSTQLTSPGPGGSGRPAAVTERDGSGAEGAQHVLAVELQLRSEERRVGKE